MVNYPMNPSAIMYAIKGDSIVKVVFITMNGTKFMYTGTSKGLIF